MSWNGSDGSLYATNPAQVTLTVVARNDLPTLTSFSRSGGSDRTVTFASRDFNEAFQDVDGDVLSRIRITSLPDQGSLKLDGYAVTLGQEIVAAMSGLTFTPAAGWTGRTSWQWQGLDGTDWSASTATITLDVLPIPAEPTNLALLASDDSGTSNSDGITNRSDVTVTGHGVVGATVTLFDGNSSKGTATVNSDGVWAAAVTGLNDGLHSFSASQTRTGSGDSERSAILTVIVDRVAPTVAITDPIDQSTLKRLSAISGTAGDADSGVALVELSLFNPARNQYSGFTEDTTSVQWLPGSSGDEEWNSWKLAGVNGLWTTGDAYRLTARVRDLAGNEAVNTVSFGFGDTVKSHIDLKQSVYVVKPTATQPVTLQGQLVLDGSGGSLAGQPVHLVITAPDGQSWQTQPSASCDKEGQFTFTDLTGFTQPGRYQVRVQYDGNLLLKSSTTFADIQVGDPAGYAILVQGELFVNGVAEGLLAHKRSTNRIYQTLLNRGFTADNIQYFNYDTNGMSQVAGDYLNRADVKVNAPSRAKLQTAIESWAADKMLAAPAPLYIIFVDHGGAESFYLGQETVTSQDLASWLDGLDSRLQQAGTDGQRARDQNQFAILGACYSGSFINEIAKPDRHRIVISSATATEKSFRGATEADGVQDGELFLQYLFQSLAQGKTFYDAFNQATQLTEQDPLVAQYGQNAFTNNLQESMEQKIRDGAGQHPLLNDNGDRIGSNELTVQRGQDGAVVQSLRLGFSRSGRSNSLANPVQIGAVAPTVYQVGSSTLLWARENNATREASEAWVTILPPSNNLLGSGSNLQISNTLATANMSYNSVAQRWELDTSQIGNFAFSAEGRYRFQYSMRDAETGLLATPIIGDVYKAKPGNQAPGSITGLQIFSAAGASSSISQVGLFDWNDVVDPEQQTISYDLILSDDQQQILYQRQALPLSQCLIDFVDLKATLPAGNYFWRVEAVDAYGATSSSATLAFSLSFPNDIPAILQGFIYNNSDYSAITGATVKLNGRILSNSERNGSLQALIPTVGATLTIEKSGYKTSIVTLDRSGAGSINQLAIGLEREMTTLRYKLNGGAETSGVSVVGSSKSDTVTLLSTGAALALSSIEKVIGTAAADQIVLLGRASVSCSGVESVTGSGQADTVTLMTGGLLAVSGVESVVGSAKTDTITLMTGGQLVLKAVESVVGSSGSDQVTLATAGTIVVAGVETVIGSSGADTLTLTGSTTAVMMGGGGADKLTGGSGPNRFRYTAAAESSPTAKDTLTNFTIGRDVIEILASLRTGSGDGTFIGSAAFSGKGACQIRFDDKSRLLEIIDQTTGGL
ncbi:MAG: hypothetical protein HQL58_09215 [Magnetococcales bacterium]|nr:hypothetical protein [Magnetococcales bacterium]